MPLGGVWTGHCLAGNGQSWTPDEPRLSPLCNLGYARDACDRFPSGNPSDAVRFTISSDDGEHIRLYYVIERDHHPEAHGPLEFGRVDNAFVPDEPGDAILLSQARAYVSSYRERCDGR